MKILQKTFDEHQALITRTLLMPRRITPSHVGSSISPETPTDNHFAHHQGHHQGIPQEGTGVEAEEGTTVEEETTEVGHPCHMEDQACSHPTDALPTLTNSSVVNPN
jgi:hypothetical protein